MRITGGTASGRILKVPKGLAVRPTPDLVKQALFNSLGARVMDARVLELFAGTGALALDCLSRGAAQVVCVESAPRHAQIIRQNLKLAGMPAGALEVRVQDAFAALAQLAAAGARFDLVVAVPVRAPSNCWMPPGCPNSWMRGAGSFWAGRGGTRWKCRLPGGRSSCCGTGTA